MSKSITTYEPDNSLKKGYFSLFIMIFDELWDNRWLTYQLFKRDFLTIYKQSVIGIFWAIIIPLVSVGSFILLNKAGILNLGTFEIPYPIFAVFGMAFWQFFSTGLVASANSLVNAGPMIVKVNFSKKSLVIASIGQSLVAFFIQFFILLVLFFFYGVFPTTNILLLPLFVFPILFLTVGLGFMLSIFNGVIRDVGNIVSLLISFLLFLTPVLYNKPTQGILSVITEYNPLYYLISTPRELILFGSVSDLWGFLISSVISLLIFFFCLITFHLTETRVTERV